MLNLPTMVLWAAMLVVLTVAGIATFYIGLSSPATEACDMARYRAVIMPRKVPEGRHC
jgi:hypothetical protein